MQSRQQHDESARKEIEKAGLTCMVALRFRIKLPAVFSSRVWEIARIDAEQGWDLYFRTYNVRSDNSPIFEFCREGDLEGVKELISNGEASPLDVSWSGDSLITVSTSSVFYRIEG